MQMIVLNIASSGSIMASAIDECVHYTRTLVSMRVFICVRDAMEEGGNALISFIYNECNSVLSLSKRVRL